MEPKDSFSGISQMPIPEKVNSVSSCEIKYGENAGQFTDKSDDINTHIGTSSIGSIVEIPKSGVEVRKFQPEINQCGSESLEDESKGGTIQYEISEIQTRYNENIKKKSVSDKCSTELNGGVILDRILNIRNDFSHTEEGIKQRNMPLMEVHILNQADCHENKVIPEDILSKTKKPRYSGMGITVSEDCNLEEENVPINVVTDIKEEKTSINKSNKTYLDSTDLTIKEKTFETGDKPPDINAKCEHFVTSHITRLDNTEKIVFEYFSENKEREEGIIRSLNVRNDIFNPESIKIKNTKGFYGEMEHRFRGIKTSETTNQMSPEQIVSKETFNNLTRCSFEKKYSSNPFSYVSHGSHSKMSEVTTFGNTTSGPTLSEIMSSVEMKQRIPQDRFQEIAQQRKLYVPLNISIPDLEPVDTNGLIGHMLQPHQPTLLKLERAHSQISSNGTNLPMSMNKVFKNKEKSFLTQGPFLSVNKKEIPSQREHLELFTVGSNNPPWNTKIKDNNQIIKSAQVNDEFGEQITEIMFKNIACNRYSNLIDMQDPTNDDDIDETDYEVAAITEGIFLSKTKQSNEIGDMFLPLETPERPSSTKARDRKLREIFSNIWNKLIRDAERATVEDLERKIQNVKINTKRAEKKCAIEEVIKKCNALRRKNPTKKGFCKWENGHHIQQSQIVPSIKMKSQNLLSHYHNVEDPKIKDKNKGENDIYQNNINAGSFERKDSIVDLLQPDNHKCAFTEVGRTRPFRDFLKQDVKHDSALRHSENCKLTVDCQTLKSDISPFTINVKPLKTLHEAKSLGINPVVVDVDVHPFPQENHPQTSHNCDEVLKMGLIKDNQQFQDTNRNSSLSCTADSGMSVICQDISQAVVNHKIDATSINDTQYGTDNIQSNAKIIPSVKRKLHFNDSFADANLESNHKRPKTDLFNACKNTQKRYDLLSYVTEEGIKENTRSSRTGIALSEASCSSWEFRRRSSHIRKRRMITRTKLKTPERRGGKSKGQRKNKGKDLINGNTVHIPTNSVSSKDSRDKMISDLDFTPKENTLAEVSSLFLKCSTSRLERFQAPFDKEEQEFLNGTQTTHTSSTSGYFSSPNMTTDDSGFSKSLKTCYISEISTSAEIQENDLPLYDTITDDTDGDGDYVDDVDDAGDGGGGDDEIPLSVKSDQIYEGCILDSSGLNEDLQNFYKKLRIKMRSTSAETSRRSSHQSTSPLIFEPKYSSLMIQRTETDEDDQDYTLPGANHVYCTVGEPEENIFKREEPPSLALTPPTPPPPPRPPPFPRIPPTPPPLPRRRRRVRPLPVQPTRATRNWLQHWMAILAGLSSLTAGYMDAWSYSELVILNPSINGTVDNGTVTSLANSMVPMGTSNPGPLYTCSGLWNFMANTPCFKTLVEIGAILGSLIAALLMKKLGCKTSLMTMTVPAVVSWIMIPYSKNTIQWLYMIRFVSGIMVGVVSIVVPFYSVEIAEIRSRGEIGSYHYTMMGVGSVAGVAFASFLPFPVAAVIPCAVPIVMLASSQWLHHSPIYLLSRGRNSEAASVLRMLRGRVDVTAELQRTQTLAGLARATHTPEPSPWVSHYVRSAPLTARAFIAVFGLMCLRQLVGGHVILRYTVEVFKKGSFWYPNASLVIGLVEVSGSLAASIFVDKIGRKVVLLTSSIGGAACMTALSVFFYLHQQDGITDNIQYLPVILLTTFIGFYGYGFGPIPWLMMAELIPGHHKFWASAVAGFINFVFFFFITQLFPFGIDLLGDHVVFPIFSVFCILASLFVSYLVPETNRKSQNDLQYMLTGAHS